MTGKQPLAFLALLIGVLLPCPPHAEVGSRIVEYFGTCDASAAVAIGQTLFVVANDEDSVLRVYRRDASGNPVSTLDLTAFLAPDPRHPETDIEAAARVGNRIYWITSHGAGSAGAPRASRHRLFATDVKEAGDSTTLTPVGTPFRDLVRVLAEAPALKDYQLGAAARIAPEKPGGLNIEGLGATPEGALLIGFRNPIPGGKALLVPLRNPEEVITGKPARLGAPVLLALGGRGVRSIDYVPAVGTYLIVAGPSGDGGAFQLYQWSGSAADAAVPIEGVDFTGLQPEAIVAYPGEPTRVQVLSDDGAKLVDGMRCKDAPAQQRSFRAVWVTLGLNKPPIR